MRIAVATVMILLAGCRASELASESPQVNQAHADAMTQADEAEHIAWAAKHSRLAGIDLFEIHAFGTDPYWSFDIDRYGVGVFDTLLAEQPLKLETKVEPTVDGQRATYRGKGPNGTRFVITVTPGDCRARDDHSPLVAELRIGATVRRGCAGSPYQMRDGWD